MALIAANIAPPAAAATCTWIGGPGSYGTGSAWSCGMPPTIADDVVIDGGNGVVSIVNATGSQGALTLTISNGDELRHASSTFTVAGSTVTNNGTITIGINSQWRGSGAALNFGGTGTIILNDIGSSFTQFLDTATIATLGSGQTVRGAGSIGLNAARIVNNGLISADVGGRVLLIDASGGNGGLAGAGVGNGNNAAFVNTGTMQATGGGTLTFAGGRYENSGTIRALAGSSVIIGSDARIVGGTLASVGDGVIVDGGGTSYLDGVTLAAGSQYGVTSATLNFSGTLVNNGTITFGANTQARAEAGTIAISGTGTIILDDVGSSFTQLFDANGAALGAGQTVRGSGSIGVNGAVISTAGLVSADIDGRTLAIDARGGNAGLAGLGIGAGGNASYVNTGTMQATGGGTLAFGGGRYQNDGTIRAQTGSVVIIGSDARIAGGTLATAGSGVIIDGAGTAYLDNVTLATGSNYALTSADLNLGTSFTNNGTLAIGINSRVRSETPTLMISGNGTIILDDAGSSFTELFDNPTTATLGAGQTVRGAGGIGANTAIVINNGVIRGDVATRTLTIDARGGNGGVTAGTGVGSGIAGLLNTNLIEASGGGIVTIAGGRYENSAAAIMRAATGSTLIIGSDARIAGGTLASVGTGLIIDGAGTAYLDNVTLATGSNYALTSADLNLGTSFVNNGTLGIGINSRVRSDTPTLTISGNGTIILDDTGSSFTQLFDNATTATLGAGQTVRGAGSIGLNTAIIVNNGVIAADVATRGIIIDARGGNGGVAAGAGVGSGIAGLFNANVIEASGGGTLTINGGRYENGAAGTMRAGVGSTLVVGSDARIVGGTLQSSGTGVIIDGAGVAYLENVTLAAGSRYDITSATVSLANSFVNNGTVNIGINSTVRSETPATVISGTGTIVLDDTASSFTQFLDVAAITTLGSGQTVRGAGSIGLNAAVIINNGVIAGDLTGRTLAIDVRAGSGGAADQVGSDGTAGLFNTGTIQATNGGIVTIGGGRYENSASGTLAVGTTGMLTMTSDANLVNLAAGGVLDRGIYRSAGGALNLRGAGSAIAVIGTSAAGTDTIVTLSGAGSTITAQGIAGAAPVAIDTTLRQVAASGRLEILNGRNLTIVAGGSGGTLTNNGIIQVGGGTLAAGSILNNNATPSSEIFGFGAITGPVFNSGTVRSAGGTLTVSFVAGSGALQSDAGSTLALGSTATTGTLANNGTLALGGNNAEVALDYTNANFGTGNAFNARANVVGTGLILADSATQTLSGAGLSGNTLNVGNVRVGGTSATTLTITNNGTLTTLRGAVQTGAAPGVSVSDADFVVGPNGGSAAATISFTGTAAGSLAGQTINVVNNFDNVADRTLDLQGAAFNTAIGSVTPGTVSIGNVRQNTLASGAITIANMAPAGAFSEGLRVTNTAFTGGTGASGVTAGVIAAGGSDAATVSISTATAGVRSGTVSFSFATNGTGTSGLAEAAIAGDGVTVNANVFATANAGVAPALAFGNVRVGDTASRSLAITNAALPGVPAGFQEGLDASIGSTPSGFSGSGSVTNLAAGGAGSVTITLDTATAGARNGTAVITLASNGTGTSELATLTLPSADVALSGAVFNRAVGAVTPDPVNLGNVRVGGTASGIVTIANTAAAGAFSEGLSVTGTSTSGGAGISGVTSGLIAAGGNDLATVTLSTATAGARSGTVNFTFATDGTGTSGLAAEAIAGDSVTVTANVFALANPFVSTPLQFGNVQQGTVQTRTVTVENRQLGGVLAAFQEGLNAGIGIISGDVQSANGNIVNLAAGGIDTTTLTVRLNTGTAGTKSGIVEILLQSNGTGTSGLGNLDLPAQNVTVLGQVETEAVVFRLAEATLAPTTVAFGSRRVGDAAPTQLLTITNSAAADGFSESLDAASGATTGRATVNGGPVTLLAAGASSNAISVGVDTSVAGANGTVTINFASNGAGTSGFGITPLPSQVVTLGGAVYQAAIAGGQPAAITLAARRVGDAAASTNLTIVNTAPGTGGFTEALSATASANNGFTTNGNGPVTTANLGVGGSQAIAISRGTGTAGAFTGTVAIANTSRAAAGSGLDDLALADQSVAVNANVYAAAVAVVDTTIVDFGTVRQGAAAPAFALGITNGASGALTDSLVTSIGTTPAGVTGTAPGALAGGASGDAGFSLATAEAGIVNGSGSLGFVSANPEMADLALASQGLTFTGTVTELAIAELFKASGAGSFAGSGNAYTLNFGSFTAGSGSVAADIGVINAILASGFGETLGGDFAFAPGSGFTFGGTSFAGLVGGTADTGNLLAFDFTGLSAGTYTSTLTLNGFSRFDGLTDLALAPVQLTVTARVTDSIGAVPEPAVWAQLILGFGAIGGFVRRRRALAKEVVTC